MRILVDADACPVKEIIVQVAKAHRLPVIMLIDTSHEINHDHYSQIITVDKGRDSVDFALIGLLKKQDIVVTQDFGVAAMALGKGAKVLNQNGMVFTNQNIDMLLMQRHRDQKIRKSGGRTKGAPKRTIQNDKAFKAMLEKLIMQA